METKADKPFKYLGLTFTPVKRLKGRASSMRCMVGRMRGYYLTIESDYNYEDFYNAAGGKVYDIFKVGEDLVIPTGYALSIYNETKRKPVKKVTY